MKQLDVDFKKFHVKLFTVTIYNNMHIIFSLKTEIPPHVCVNSRTFPGPSGTLYHFKDFSWLKTTIFKLQVFPRSVRTLWDF